MDLADDPNVFKLINKNTEIYNRADFFFTCFFFVLLHTHAFAHAHVYILHRHTQTRSQLIFQTLRKMLGQNFPCLNRRPLFFSCKFTAERGITPGRGLTQNVNSFEKEELLFIMQLFTQRDLLFSFKRMCHAVWHLLLLLQKLLSQFGWWQNKQCQGHTYLICLCLQQENKLCKPAISRYVACPRTTEKMVFLLDGWKKTEMNCSFKEYSYLRNRKMQDISRPQTYQEEIHHVDTSYCASHK